MHDVARVEELLTKMVESMQDRGQKLFTFPLYMMKIPSSDGINTVFSLHGKKKKRLWYIFPYYVPHPVFSVTTDLGDDETLDCTLWDPRINDIFREEVVPVVEELKVRLFVWP